MNLAPLKWNLPPVTQEDTYPAIQITESGSETDLIRVRMKVRDVAGSEVLSLDSDTTGMTITSGTAGSWDFQIDEIDDETTRELSPGFHSYDMEFTDETGAVRTFFAGSWEILKQITY